MAFQMIPIRYATLKKEPASVRMTALIAWAKPAPKNNTASNSAPATIRHFTHAESAMARSASTTIQMMEETIRLAAIHRWSHAQRGPARLACTAHRTIPGTQVISDKRIPSTEAFPNTYSNREKGRQKYSGKAPLARSGEIRPGPAN